VIPWIRSGDYARFRYEASALLHLAVPMQVPRGAHRPISAVPTLKLQSGQLQVAPLMAKEAGTALVVPFQVPLNPMPDKVAPGAMLPL
jgi:hypothetical protein